MNPAARILLVEDSPSDIRLTIEVLKEADFPNELAVVQDGEEAIEYLSRKGKHAAASRPDLVLLDLNLPKISGHEVLRFVREHDELHDLPVIVLTSSKAEEDVAKSRALNADCHIAKPVSLVQFLEVVKIIEKFFLNHIRPPTKGT